MFESVRSSLQRRRWSWRTSLFFGLAVLTATLALSARHLVFALFWGSVSAIPLVLGLAHATARPGRRVSILVAAIATVILIAGFAFFMLALVTTQAARGRADVMVAGGVGASGYAISIWIAVWLLRSDAEASEESSSGASQ